MSVKYRPLLALFLFLACATQSTVARAQGSFDVLVGAQGNLLTVGFYSHAGGVTPAGLAVDYLSGQKLFRANFGDLAGGPRATDDPGFRALPGTFRPGSLLQARGLGALEYWSPASRGWGAAPAGESIRLFGAVPTDIAVAHLFCASGDPFLCDPGLAAQYPLYEAGTAFTSSGVSGPNPAIIDETNGAGVLHAHLDWFLERAGGAPAEGAYMITLGLVAPGTGYLDSEAFKILFNYGLPADEYARAVASRIVAPIVDPSPTPQVPGVSAPVAVVPVPGSAVLFATGLLGLGWARRRARNGTLASPA